MPPLNPPSSNGYGEVTQGAVGAEAEPWLVDGSGVTQPVSGPLTDTQLRALAVATSLSTLPNPSNLDVALSTRLKAADTLAAVTTVGTITNPVTANQGTNPWATRESPAASTPVSAKNAAPSASAVQADTGALAAGDYDFDIYLVASDTVAVGKGLVVEHRNAANNATLFTPGGCEAPGSAQIAIRKYTLATNERIRVIAGTAAGAASSMYVSCIVRRSS